MVSAMFRLLHVNNYRFVVLSHVSPEEEALEELLADPRLGRLAAGQQKH